MNDIGTAFSAPFKDPEWGTKFILGALVVLLCVTGLGIFVLAGYFVELTQRVMRKEQYPLPAWTDLGVKFVVGVKYAVVWFLYALPVVLLALPIVMLMALTAMNESSASMAIVASIYLFAFALLVVPVRRSSLTVFPDHRIPVCGAREDLRSPRPRGHLQGL